MNKCARRCLGYGLLLMTASLAVSCGSSSMRQPPPQPPDVYVAGDEADDSNTNIAKYWKNGTPVVLGAGTFGSDAESIFVSGNDVYVAGREGSAQGDVAKYWKNGVGVALTSGAQGSVAIAVSIFVDGSDVYVAGFDGFEAEYWKNGVAVPLTQFTTNNGAEGWSIALSGTDVYVAGWQYVTTQIDPTHTNTAPVAMLWKNGVPTQLSNPLGFGVAQSMFISGNDIYVAGNTCPPNTGPGCDQATYWKNDVPVVLTSQTPTAASSIFVSGSDVYVSGNDLTGNGAAIADLWTDGTLTQLSNGGTSAANAVVVSGSDVYVAGANLTAGGAAAGYWKNGVFIPLTDGTHFATAFSMTVVTH